MLSSLKVERIVLGVALVGLGVLITLANFERIDLLSALRMSWPALLVLWGALEVIVSFARRQSSEADR
jgi:LiaI-LiaF-like transmembrane region